MDRFARILELHKILGARRTPISRKELQDRLECSRATVKRAIDDSRTYLNTPIIYDREHNGYLIDPSEAGSFEFPGLWFNESELLALLMTQKLLADVQPGLLEPLLKPLKSRLKALLEHECMGSDEIARRIRIMQQAPRRTDLEDFKLITNALIKRQRIRILYRGRASDEMTERWVSPQRLIYYRDNWYLAAWCHQRDALRSFSIDRMHVAEASHKAKNIPARQLDAFYEDSFGLFSGKARHKAVLRFSPKAARWVADELWHPNQNIKPLKDGGIELTVPYSDARELIMDILKYGEDIEVIKPAALRRVIRERLEAAHEKYVE